MDAAHPAAAALDELAAALFSGEAGKDRLAPLVQRFEACVGTIPPGEPWSEAWWSLRLDWALTEAPLEPDGETWAHRVAAARVEGVPPDLGRRCLATYASVFLVEVGRHAVAIDRITGVAAYLAGFVAPAGTRGLFEMRVAFQGERILPVRPPEPLPDEVHPVVESMRMAALASGRPPSLDPLRRGRLALLRNPRLAPSSVFPAFQME